MREANLSRRGFLGLGAVAAVSTAAVGLAGCASQAAPANEGGQAAEETSGYRFMQKPEPITEVDETHDYDVVVVGLGAAGMGAAIGAVKNGAKVAIVQKEIKGISQGNSCSGVDLEQSNEEGVLAYINKIMAESDLRPKRELVDMYVRRSGEAVMAVYEYGQAGSLPPIIRSESDVTFEGTDAVAHAVVVAPGTKPIMWQDGIENFAEVAEADPSIDIFYEYPGVQLVQDESGAVTGVICEIKNGGYAQFNAANGVILATGDYQNDEEMVEVFCPDCVGFDFKQVNKTGDGHKMALWAGAHMERVGHTKMIHDMDSGPMFTADIPFLNVDMQGNRFCDEKTNGSMMFINNLMRDWTEDKGQYCQIFDAAYEQKYADSKPPTLEKLMVYMPEEDVERTGVIERLIDTYMCDTLEELAEKLQIKDVDNFLKTVNEYNKMCEAGIDSAFGKQGAYMQPIDTPPYIGTHRHVRVSAILGGIDVDAQLHALDENMEPIKGLFVAGNTAGPFYGGVDYPAGIPGMSVGRAVTFGYVAGESAAQGK